MRPPGMRAWSPMRSVEVLLIAMLSGCASHAFGADCAPLEFVGDGIPTPLSADTPDPDRGRTIATATDRGDCTICHALPVNTPDPRFHGNLGPPLYGVGARLDAAQLRARIADPKRLDPHTVMPAYCSTNRRWRVARAQVGAPILSAAEIEDLIAWLQTLDGATR